MNHKISNILGVINKENSPSCYKHLFDEPLYRRVGKGSGLGKLEIYEISLLPSDPLIETLVKVTFRDNSISKKSTFSNYVIYDNNKLQLDYPKYFKSPIEYFLWMESSNDLFKQKIRISEQYQYEFNQIKQKYPEYFL